MSLTPDISWRYLDTTASTQAEYQVQVGSDADWAVAEWWDSGQISSADSSVTYGGAPLEDFHVYYVRVRANNGFDWGGWSMISFTVKVGGTIHVPEDVTTIDRAVYLAGEGDQILVGPGTYVEQISMRGKRDLLIQSTAGRDSTIITPPDSNWTIINFLGGEDTTAVIDGFTFRKAAYGGSLCSSSGATFSNNRFTQISRRAVYASQSNGLIFTENRVDSSFGGLFSRYQKIRVENNEFCYNTFQGYNTGAIVISWTEGSLVHGNVIAHNVFSALVDPGIWLDRVQRATVSNNTIVHNSSAYSQGEAMIAAIYLSNADDSEVRNNLVAFNDCDGILADEACAGNVLEFNDVYGNGWLDYNGAVAGWGSIAADPLLVDPDNDDFRLSAGSPCIDAGDPRMDYMDPNGTRNDIGALPFDGYGNLPIALRINMGADDVSHVVSETPTIYWSYFDSLTAIQAAYELEIGTDFDWTEAEMWSTGVVSSGDTSVVYAGAALTDGTDYILRLRLNDGSDWGDWTGGLFHKNGTPTMPVPVWPTPGDTISSGINLIVTTTPDVENDSLFVDFEVYQDAGLTILDTAINGVVSINDTCRSGAVLGLHTGQTYWWRGRTSDGYGHSEWSLPWSFVASADIHLFSINNQSPLIDEIECDMPIRFRLKFQNDYDAAISGLSNGFVLYSPDGGAPMIDTAFWDASYPELGSYFDLGMFTNMFPGETADSVGFGAARIWGPGLPSGTAYSAWVIDAWLSCDDAGKTVCLDSTFVPPNWIWQWMTEYYGTYVPIQPSWDGPYCFTVNQCCVGMRGDIDQGDPSCNVADLTFLVNYLFGGGPVPECMHEANVNGDPLVAINIADLTYLVDYLFNGGPEPYACGLTNEGYAAKSTADPIVEVKAAYEGDSTLISIASSVDLKGVQLTLLGAHEAQPVFLGSDSMSMKWHYSDGQCQLGILDLDGPAVIAKGAGYLVSIPGAFTVKDVIVADTRHRSYAALIGEGKTTDALPTTFGLSQNYPNPFNPSTTIDFALPENTHVKLEVFNILGRRVAVLLDRDMEAGTHNLVWNSTSGSGSQVASGVYFYRLKAGDYVGSRKMLLLK